MAADFGGVRNFCGTLFGVWQRPSSIVRHVPLLHRAVLLELHDADHLLHHVAAVRDGALDLDVVEGLIVVVAPVGVALVVTDTLLIAIAGRGGRREAWHTFFSPSKRPMSPRRA